LNKKLREKEEARWKRLVNSASSKAPPPIAKFLNRCGPCLTKVLLLCEYCVPCYMRIFKAIAAILVELPTDLFGVIWGMCLVFFGGFYPLTMAAFEAARQCGGEDTWIAIHDLSVEFHNAKIASEADDLVDDDNDGIADVEQISAKELIHRKNHLFLASTDPTVLDRGFNGIYSAWLAVIAVLKIQFAQMIALGAAIGGFLAKLLRIPMTQILVHVIKPDTHKWIPQIISYICKIISIIIAYHVEKIISAAYSALRGGLMVTRNFMAILSRKKILHIDPDQSYLDEILGWCLAIIGFLFQFQMGFGPPLPIAILLWPFSFTESALLWAITTAPPVEATS